MALKIRLRQQGRTNRVMYRVVVTDARVKRDGAYVESLGWYNPHETELERNVSINPERARFWIDQGAQLTEKAAALLGRAAPDVVAHYRDAALAKREKMRQKRRARKAA